MRTVDAQQKVLELAPLLNEALMRSKLAEFEKGGLPGQSMSDGRGGDSPCPVAEKPRPKGAPPWRAHSDGKDHPDRVLGVRDATDREIRSARREYEQNLTHAALALEQAVRLQNAWTVPRTDDTEKDKALADEKKTGTPCKNVWCNHWMSGFGNDRPRDGRCMACDRYWKRNGVERDPRKLESA